jgi:hypothetical protein
MNHDSEVKKYTLIIAVLTSFSAFGTIMLLFARSLL